jgi:hypothetical protein
MLRSCEILQRGAHTDGGAVFLPPGVDARQCWGFMSAVQQFATLADQNGKAFLNACPPEDTKRYCPHLRRLCAGAPRQHEFDSRGGRL